MQCHARSLLGTMSRTLCQMTSDASLMSIYNVQSVKSAVIGIPLMVEKVLGSRGLSGGRPTPAGGSSVPNETFSLHAQLEPLDGANEGIFFLSLTRAKEKNAIGRQLLNELDEALDNLRKEQNTRCVVVRSTASGVFCAGADLKERANMSHDECSTFVNGLRNAFRKLESLPMPTICAVDGFALGGGAELALACDIRVCGREAQFAFPETRLGIIPGAGGTQRLPRIVGKSRAKELIFTGRRVDAHEALNIGLVDHMEESGSCEDVALSFAREISAAGPIALRMAKLAINAGYDTSLDIGLQFESSCYAQLLPTRDRLEGLAAFAEKRQPKFTGQ